MVRGPPAQPEERPREIRHLLPRHRLPLRQRMFGIRYEHHRLLHRENGRKLGGSRFGTRPGDQRQVDDPVGAISVHGFGGCWGVLSVGLFANGLLSL